MSLDFLSFRYYSELKLLCIEIFGRERSASETRKSGEFSDWVNEMRANLVHKRPDFFFEDLDF